MARKDLGGPLKFGPRCDRGWRSLDESDPGMPLWCGFEEYTVDADYRQVVSDPEHYTAVYVMEGEGVFVDGTRGSHAFGPGDVFVRHPQSKHELLLCAGGHMCACYLTLPTPMYEVLSLTGVIPLQRPPIISPGVRRDIPERMRGIMEELKVLPVRQLGFVAIAAQQLVADLYRWHAMRHEATPDERIIAAACDRLMRDFSQTICIPSLARELGCGYSRFRRIFLENTGVPPGEYRIRRRIERAQVLLADLSLSVKEIAFQLGYPDVHGFTRQFRRVTGIPPKRFRMGLFYP